MDWGGTGIRRNRHLIQQQFRRGADRNIQRSGDCDNHASSSAYAANSQVAYSITKGLAGRLLGIRAKHSRQCAGVKHRHNGILVVIWRRECRRNANHHRRKTLIMMSGIGTSTNAQSLYVRARLALHRGWRIGRHFTNRWLRANTTAESGSDTGSNFELIAVGDAGTTVDTR